MSVQGSKACPNCRHQLWDAIAQHEGVDPYHYVKYDTIQEWWDSGMSWIHCSIHIGKNNYQMISKGQDKGGVPCVRTYHKIYRAEDDYDYIEAKYRKVMSEFNTVVPTAGTHRDSLGGGWHQTVQAYCFNGVYYADIECTC